MKLPNFVVIGVQKAGTTSIYNYLKHHPQIYMSPVKETNFFEKDWDSIPPHVRDKKRNGINSFEKYCQLFEGVTNEVAVGEASPNYLFHHHNSIEQIKKYLPDVKLIAVLRNPVDRAYSDYLMHVRDAIGKPSTLAEQVQKKPNKSFMLLKGLYHDQLKHFLNEFGSDTVKVYLYDDLRQDAVLMMQNMYRFLGVDDTFCPDISKKSQVAKVPRNQTLNTLLRTKNPLRSLGAGVLRTFLPDPVRANLRSQILDLNSGDKSSLPLSLHERKLLLSYYREDILKLQDLIQRDLSAWLELEKA